MSIKPYSEIPGPKYTSRIGSTKDFARRPLEFLLDLQQEFGNIVKINVHGQEFVYFFDPSDIKLILKDKYQCFEKKNPGFQRFKLLFGEGLISIDGKQWRKHSRIISPTFHVKRLNNFLPIMSKHTQERTNKWKNEDEIDLFHEFHHLALDIILESLFGIKLSSENSSVVESFKYLCLEAANNYKLPTLKEDSTEKIIFRKNLEVIYDFIDDLIYSDKNEEQTSDSFLSRIIMAKDDQSGGGVLGQNEVRDEILTLFGAGHETVANTLCFVFQEIAQNELIQRNLSDYCMNISDVETLSSDWYFQNDYLERVIHETMRLNPVIWSIGRQSTTDLEIGGYKIPMQTFVVVSPYVTHRLEEYWDEPHVFNPERFDSPKVSSTSNFTFFPFGQGPRICLGRSFALMEIKYITWQLVQKFQFRLKRDMQERSTSFSMFPKNGLPFFVKSRR